MLLVILLIVISSCTKAECKTSADCTSKKCSLTRCEDKKCIYTTQSNCCGNGIKDSTEGGNPGNKCTCPADYGGCEGKGKVNIGSKTEDAAYAHYYCNDNNQCVLGVEEKDAAPQNYLDMLNMGFFKASLVLKYNEPFDISNNAFQIKVALDDASNDLAFPVELTKLKLLYSSQNARIEQLIAEKDLGVVLDGIGDETAISASLNLDYKPKELEEIGSFRYSMDYTYKKRVASGKAADGTKLYTEEIVRATFNSPSKPVFFIRSGVAD